MEPEAKRRCGILVIVGSTEARLSTTAVERRLARAGFSGALDSTRRFGDRTRLFISDAGSRIVEACDTSAGFHVHCGYVHRGPVRVAERIEAIWDGRPGMYAAVRIAADTGAVELISDPANFKSLFVHRDRGVIAASDSLGMLWTVFGAELDQNERDRAFFLTYGYYPDNRTVYESVTAIRPGRLTRIDREGVVREDQRAVAAVGSDRKPVTGLGDESAVIAALYKEITGALKEYAAGLDDVGVLVGGFDSALVAALLKRLGLSVTGYTFRYPDDRYNQTRIPDLVDGTGIEHEWVDITPRLLEAGLRNYHQLADRPTNWAAYIIQTTALAERAARDGRQAIFTGDGCDGLFYGYPPVFRNARIYSKRLVIPAPLRRLLTGQLNLGIFERNLGHPWRLFMRLVRNFGDPTIRRLLFYFKVMDAATIARLFRLDADTVADRIRSGEEATLRELDATVSPLKAAYLIKSLYGPNRIKITASMRVSGLAVCSPFLHPAVKSLVEQLPEHMLRPGGVDSPFGAVGKHVLIEMADSKQLLPASVIHQKKLSAVTGPSDWWAEEHFASTMEELLENIGLDRHDPLVASLIRAPLVERIYRKLVSDDDLTKHALNLLASYGAFFAES